MAVINQNTEIAREGRTAARLARRLPVVSLLLGGLALVGMLTSIWAIFFYAPTDAIEGVAQRIFYFHVPTAIIGMGAMFVVALAGGIYLWKKDERWDWVALAAAEVGTVFISLALVTGSIWGKTTWGTWWTWDARLTTTLVLWFVYIAYLMVRVYLGRTEQSARIGAVLAIIGAIDIPIIYESVNWWRTLHPQTEVGAQGALPVSVLLVLLLTMVTFSLLSAFLMIQLYQLVRLQTLAQRLRANLE